MRAELLAGAAELSTSLFASAPTARLGETAESSFAMLHGLYWLAANFASRKPALLVIDDLHWTDEPSLRWLVYLARRLEGLPLLLLLGTRPPAQANTPPLVNEIIADPQATLIRPGPLGPRSIKDIARGFFGLEPEEAFTAELENVSGGNPLFARALLDAAARESIPPTAGHAARLRELGPQAVSHAVAARLGRLPDEATKLIRAAAILGDGTELGHVAALAGLEPSRPARQRMRSSASTSSAARTRSSSSIRSCAPSSTKRWVQSSRWASTAAPPSCCSPPANCPNMRRPI